LGWAWIFFPNVPLGFTAIVLSFSLLAPDHEQDATRRLDLPGAATVTAGLVLLVYGLTRAEASGFASPLTLTTLAVAALLLAAFLLVERSSPDPLVPLPVFRNRHLTGSAAVAFANTATTGSVGILTVLYVQNVLSYPPAIAGLLGLPFSLSVVAGSFLGARLTGRFGARSTMALGLLGISVATLVALGISAEGGLGFVIANATLSGLALGCSAVASTTRGTSALAEGERGLASGLLNSSAQIGTALGLAVFFTLAAARTDALAGGGVPSPADLVEGYKWAFVGAACVAAVGAATALALIREDGKTPSGWE
jgi:MFS family permease